MKTYISFLLLCLPLLTTLYATASPTNHALLIGVGEYDNPKITDLAGTINDAKLLAKVLKNKGFQENNITLLIDSQTTPPTRANILAALDALVAKAKPNDFIVLAFAGHGSQQPAKPVSNNHEPDGKDEFILPKDTGNWNEKLNTTENAILDNEIHIYLEKLRAKGAFVWLIFDNCHAGTMTRAGEMAQIAWQPRYVEPETLGIPITILRGQPDETMLSEVNNKANPDETMLSEVNNKANYVAFYATQSTQLEPEFLFPQGAKQQQVHGLLTYHLAQVLSNHHNLSYRQLGQQILQNYAASNIYNPTPLIEGALDRMVFSDNQSTVKQWPLYQEKGKPMIGAGRLQQLEKGSIFAVLDKPLDTIDKALGYVEMLDAGLFASEVQSIKYQNKLALDKIPHNVYARLVAPNFILSLHVAKPNTKNNLIKQVLRKLDTDKVQIHWVERDADIYLRVQDSALWLVPSDGQLVTQGKARNLSLSLKQDAKQLQTKLTDYLLRIAKVHNLLKLSPAMRGEQMQTKVHAEIVKNNVTETLQGELPALKNGTHLRFWVENKESQAVDVTMLFIDSHYGVYVDYPNPTYEETNRIEAGGQTRPIDMTLDTNETVGIEQFIIIAVRARQNQVDMVNFSFLQQARIELRDFSRYSKQQAEVLNLFADAGFGGEDKRGRRLHEVSLAKTFMQVLSWRLME